MTLLRKIGLLAGLLNGRRAFAPPAAVTIGITTRCNLRCRNCCYHSVKLGDDTVPRREMPVDFAEAVIAQLRDFGVREIVLTGPAATDPQAAATVESVCGVRASLAVPIRMVDEPEACMHGNEWIAAIGSACAERI